jgi:hypothetical protein
MSSAEAQLTLLVPFYTDNSSTIKPLLAELCKQSDKQRFCFLQRLLSRADRQAVKQDSVDGLLCDLFGVSTEDGVPYAALSWLADTGSVADKDLLRIDPVHLHPDMEYVLLFDSQHFELGAEQAAELVDALNEFLRAEGWHIEAPCAERWYLQGVNNGSTGYTPLKDVVGENILPHMPSGDLQDKWRQILNELQMLLHIHPVNEQREQQGVYTINGVWPWGNASLRQVAKTDFRVCYGDAPLLLGLSVYCGVTCGSEVVDILNKGKTLVYLEEMREFSIVALQEYLRILEEDWLQPVSEKLRRGELDEVKLYIGSTWCYTLTKKTLHRWWRRNRSLGDLLAQH